MKLHARDERKARRKEADFLQDRVHESRAPAASLWEGCEMEIQSTPAMIIAWALISPVCLYPSLKSIKSAKITRKGQSSEQMVLEKLYVQLQKYDVGPFTYAI
jgi:hypothetical protein